MTSREPFVPPPYPYDRLDGAKKLAAKLPGGIIELSVGTPCDPPPASVIHALGTSNAERGYPPSLGTEAYRSAASRWMQRRLGVSVPTSQVAGCIGTKEFVATLPQWLHLRRPDLDTVLYPAVAYPTYEMGAVLAGLRAVPVPLDAHLRPRLDCIDPSDADRALALWVNSPSNPTGAINDLQAAATWGRTHGVPVFSDECYVEFSWTGKPRTILESGTEGVVGVHSLSKRSNLAGGRAGFYAGDAELVAYLGEVRKHVGLMIPGPIQAAAIAAFDDDAHVDAQRLIYRRRLERCAAIIGEWAHIDIPLPEGGFYLWFAVPGGDSWAFAERLAAEGGAIVSPGEFYGSGLDAYVRVAVVQPDDQVELLAQRLGVLR